MNRKNFLVWGAATVILFCCAAAAPAKTLTIGVIEDCTGSLVTKAVFKEIRAEIKSLTRSEFTVRFPKEKHMVAQCTPDSIRSGINRLMADPGVDLVMALGHLGSYYLCSRQGLPKPAIAGVVLNPELQGIPYVKGTSGRKNLTYIAFSTDFKKNIQRLKQVTDFKTAAYLFDEDFAAIMPRERIASGKLSTLLDTDMTFIPVGKDPGPSLDQLSDRFDAVFLGNLEKLDDNGKQRIIEHLKTSRLPGFSFLGKGLVQDGLLAGYDQSAAEKKYVRRMGLLVQRVLLGEDMSRIPVTFSKEEKLIINMDTARRIGVSPSFAILAEAEVINQESALAPALDAPVSTVPSDTAAPLDDSGTTPSRAPIAVSPAVSHESIRAEQERFEQSVSAGDRLTLLDAVRITLENNPGLQAKEREVLAGETNVTDALAQLYPQLDTGLAWRVIDEDRTSSLTGTAERAWDITAQVTQIIYSDQASTNLKTSRYYQKALELTENQARLDAVLETGVAYLTLLKARANARIQLENLRLIRSNLNLANNRYKAGYSGPSDVYRLESEAATAYSNYLEAQAQVSASKIHLHQLLDLDLERETAITDISLNDGLFVVSSEASRQDLDIKNPAGFKAFRDFFVGKGLEQSPEIAALDQQIMAQDAVYEYARRSYWSPDVTAFGSVGNTLDRSGEGSDFDNSSAIARYFDEPSDTYWTVGVNVTLPLYQGGAKSAQKIRALETKNQLAFEKRDIANQIAENIRMALVEVGASFPAIDLTRLSAVSAQKNLELVVDAYTKGAVSIVDLLDAQNASLNTKTLAENAVYDFFMDFIRAERAAGKFSLLMSPEEKAQWLLEMGEYR